MIPVEYIEEVMGLYFRSIVIPKAGMIADQHVHDHDHATYIGSGKIRAWGDGKFIGEFEAGRAVGVKAGVYHKFQALEDGTRLTCVHDIASAESVKAKGV